GNHVENQTRSRAANNEGGGAPKSHRAVSAAERTQPAQRISIGQRHERRVKDGGECKRNGDGESSLPQSQRAITEHRQRRGDRDDRAQGVLTIGDARRKRDCEQTHDHGDGEHHSDGARTEPLGREPERQEWHLHTERGEQRGVEDRKPQRKGGKEERRRTKRSRRDGSKISSASRPRSLPYVFCGWMEACRAETSPAKKKA